MAEADRGEFGDEPVGPALLTMPSRLGNLRGRSRRERAPGQRESSPINIRSALCTMREGSTVYGRENKYYILLWH